MKFLLVLSLFFFSNFLYADNQQFLTEVEAIMNQERYRVNIKEINITKDSTDIIKDIENILPLYLATENPFIEENEHILPIKNQIKHPIVPIYHFTILLGKYIQYANNSLTQKEEIAILDKILSDTQQLMKQTYQLLPYYVGIGIYENILKSFNCNDKTIQNILSNHPPKDADYFFKILESDMDMQFNETKQYILNEENNPKLSKEAKIYMMQEAEKYYFDLKEKALNALQIGTKEALDKYEAYYQKTRDEDEKLADTIFLTPEESIRLASHLMISVYPPEGELKLYHKHQEIIERYNTFISYP